METPKTLPNSVAYKGLTENQVLAMRKMTGENTLPVKEGRPWFYIYFDQFRNPLVYILFFVAAVSLVFREYTNACLIGIVVFINALMGFFQEYHAQKTLIALRKILKPKALVIRDGERKEIEARELVPGDLVVLYPGHRIPADGKLLEGVNLLAHEAILTGEEEAVAKKTADGQNLLFMGSTVIGGKGIMEVVKTGKGTEIGRIGESLSSIDKEKTPIQIKLEKFTKNLARIVALVCLLFVVIGVLFGEDFWSMFKTALVLSVAAVPEGLPIAITVILALGTRKILKRQGLVRKLLSVETLGSTSVICVDKTGTLTEGVMKVLKADFYGRPKALMSLILTNERRSNLEIALWNYAGQEIRKNPRDIYDACVKIHEEPFDSEKKYALTINNVGGIEHAFIVGAPEVILTFCGGLEGELGGGIVAKIEQWAGEGLRVVGAAFKTGENLEDKQGYTWLGLIGVKDPVRAGAKEAIAATREAGIRVKIVTGDHRKTAESAAINLGLPVDPEAVLEGRELEEMSEESLKNVIDRITIFARITPHQKLKIVKALQEKGEIVAMTGDGVNDAPALKKADIGIVVGTASDVAKEAADLVLLDSNFKTIAAACEEGRLIFSNIKKVVAYALSNAFSEIFLILGAVLLNFPLPLTIIQILWLHIICDGPPDIMLGFEPKEKFLMKKKPEELKHENILAGYMKFLIFAISFIDGILALLFFWYFYRRGNPPLARTIAFATIATIDLVYAFSFKNLEKPIIRTENFFKNKFLFFGVAYGLVLTFAAIYVPFLNRFLGTVPLKISHWLSVLGVGVAAILLIEIVKFIEHRRRKS